MSITDHDLVHHVEPGADVDFTWDYERTRLPLSRLYEKAKVSQWNASDLPWDTDVDVEQVASQLGGGRVEARFRELAALPGSPLRGFGEREFRELGVESWAATLSQFVHGEQGALLCCSLIVAQVPWIDAKYYASSQVFDEARHVEVFSRYLEEKLTGTYYPINPDLGSLLDDLIGDARWDMTYLGMQIIIEGLALSSFGAMQAVTPEPLFKQLLRYVMSDEARHVAFGVLSLRELYDGLTAAEIKERQEFAYDAVIRMQKRYVQPELWERFGVDVGALRDLFADHKSEDERAYQVGMFAKVVPNCKKLGLLDAGDGWLRDRFVELDIIRFEDGLDTSEEYALLDEVAKDRAAG